MTKKLSTPFAINSTLRNDVPVNATNDQTNKGIVGYNNGWTSINKIPLENGGQPPYMEDMNGVLFDITGNIVDINKGLPQYYDNSYATLIGGYPVGARLVLNDNSTTVISTIANNQNNPNTNMIGWVKFSDLETKGKVDLVDTIADLANVPAVDGKTVFVKGYYKPNFSITKPYKGGGVRVYSSSKSSTNDGFLCINGWILVSHDLDVYQAGCVGDGSTDDTVAFQRAINAVSTTNYVGYDDQQWTIKNKKLLVRAGQYYITEPLLFGAGLHLEFESGSDQDSQPFNDNTTVIQANLTNPKDWVLKSANYDKNGNLQAYDAFSASDDGIYYTSCNNVKLHNVFINAVNQMYGGIKLCGGQRSEIKGFCLRGFDYGVGLSDSWASKVDGYTEHSICGVLSYRANNNIHIDGYYTKHRNTTTSGTQLIKEVNGSVGMYHRNGQSVSSSALVCEYNDYSLGIVDSVGSLNSLYTENCQVRSGFLQNSKIRIGATNGFWDKATYQVLDNSYLKIDVWGQAGYGYTSSNSFVPNVDESSKMVVGTGLEFYHPSITYEEFTGTIYATNTTDNNNPYFTGFSERYAVPISIAMRRVSDITTTNNGKATKDFIIILINDNATYTMTENSTFNNTNVEIIGKSVATTINFSTQLWLLNGSAKFTKCNLNLTTDNTAQRAILISGISKLVYDASKISSNVTYENFHVLTDGTALNVALLSTSVALDATNSFIRANDTKNNGYLTMIIDAGSDYSVMLGRSDKGLTMSDYWKLKLPPLLTS